MQYGQWQSYCSHIIRSVSCFWYHWSFNPLRTTAWTFGISGTVFHWLKSYISNRQQRVHIDGSLSCPQDLHFGVPQGSVLGAFLFCLYTTSISQIITTHDVIHHMYADDTQVYIELSQSDTHKSISSLSDCLTDISLWMKLSKLKLNSDQTEFIIIGTKQQTQTL